MLNLCIVLDVFWNVCKQLKEHIHEVHKVHRVKFISTPQDSYFSLFYILNISYEHYTNMDIIFV